MADKSKIKERLRGLLDPIVALLADMGVTPLAVTVAGVIISFGGAVFVGKGHLFLGGLVLLLAGLCDTIDGSLARRTGKVSTFGAFIDSTVDRITEIAYFGAMIFYYTGSGAPGGIVVFFILLAVTGSFLTSYTRARAEGLGLDCTVGWLERPERVGLLVIGLLLGRVVLAIVVVILAVLSVVTFVQRVLHVRRLTAGEDRR